MTNFSKNNKKVGGMTPSETPTSIDSLIIPSQFDEQLPQDEGSVIY